MPLPFVDLAAQRARLKDDMDHRIQAVMDHGQFIMGPEVAELEDALCSFAGCKHAITLSSGTDALLAILMARGVGPGDAIFLPSLTFPASAEVVALVGAVPIFVDVLPDTCNMDPASLEAKISQAKAASQNRPKAIIAVDLYGLPADYLAINEIARRENLALIADAAQSFGGALNNRRVGTLADTTAISFFPAKPLGCYGDGGGVLTDDDELAQVLRSIRAHGKGESKYDIDRIGLNARLDTIQAAVLLSKLTVFEEELERREALSLIYDLHLANHLCLPGRQAGCNSTWAQYTVQLEGRDALAAALKEEGIPTGVYYPRPMHMQPAYKEFGEGEGSLPVAERLASEVLSLPMHPYLADEEAGRICHTINSILSP